MANEGFRSLPTRRARANSKPTRLFCFQLVPTMADVPQTDVSRPSALPTAKLLQRNSLATIEQNSAEYLEAIEEEWNKKVDVEVETLVENMSELVTLASVSSSLYHIAVILIDWNVVQIGDKDKFRIVQEAFETQCRAESMVRMQPVNNL